MMESFKMGDAEDREKMRQFMGPGMIYQHLLQTIQFCWMDLPPERQNMDEVEKEVRRLVDRAFHDLREDERIRKGQ